MLCPSPLLALPFLSPTPKCRLRRKLTFRARSAPSWFPWREHSLCLPISDVRIFIKDGDSTFQLCKRPCLGAAMDQHASPLSPTEPPRRWLGTLSAALINAWINNYLLNLLWGTAGSIGTRTTSAYKNLEPSGEYGQREGENLQRSFAVFETLTVSTYYAPFPPLKKIYKEKNWHLISPVCQALLGILHTLSHSIHWFLYGEQYAICFKACVLSKEN